MPTLKQLTCAVEWAGSNLALDEYRTTYADGYVETYIAVPSTPTPFSIHLKSNGYIAPGLAMFVYMDGIYQCNRNRHNLRIPDEGTRRRQTEIEFRVRQKEEVLADGTFQGLQWKFEKVNVDTNVEAQNQAPHDGEYVGTIEVVVLRCYSFETKKPPLSLRLKGSRKKALSSSSCSSSSIAKHQSDSDDIGGWFDGAGDSKPMDNANAKGQTFGLDGSYDPDSPKSTWGNRGGPQSPVKDTKDMKSKIWDYFDAPPSPIEGAKGEVGRGWNNFDTPCSPANETKGKEPKSWDNFDAPRSTLEQSKGKEPDSAAWDAWDNPPAAAEESKPTASTDPWKVPGPGKAKTTDNQKPAANGDSKPSPLGIWKNDTSIPKTKPKMGTVEMLNDTEGVMHPSTSTKKRDTSRDSLQSDWKIAGSERGRSPSVKIRGGGPGSYRVSSPVDGRTSPGVVININNGPPPPRDWKTEVRAEREAEKLGKASSHKIPTPPPADDPWTMDLPVEDYSKQAESHAPPGDWGWDAGNNEEKKEESGNKMPGGWGETQENDDWGASNPQNNNDANWETQETGGNDDWGNTDVNKGDTQKNDLDWGNDINDKPQDKNDDKKQDDNWNNDLQQDGFWDNDDKKGDDEWGKKPQQYESWDNNVKKGEDEDPNNKAGTSNFWGAAEPDKEKGKENQKQKPMFSFGNSKARKQSPKGSKKERKTALKTAAQEKAKAEVEAEAKPVDSNEQKDDAGRAQSPSKKGAGALLTPKTSLPGAWSPKLKPVADKPSKRKSVFSISSPPQPKPYWSAWKEIENLEAINGDTPRYNLPSEVANRNNTSHQVRPGKPAAYAHKTATPKYMDTQENPYAVFVFHYRDKEIIEAMLKTTIEEPEDSEKQRLATLSKDELVEELMKMKEKLSSQASGSKKSNESDKATFKSNPNGIGNAAEGTKLSKKLKNFESSKVTTPEAVSGWLEKTDDHEPGDGEKANGNGKDNENAPNKNNDTDIDKTNDGARSAWNFFGNPKGKGKKGKNKKINFDNWGNTATDADAGDDKPNYKDSGVEEGKKDKNPDNEKTEAEKKEDEKWEFGGGGDDIWGGNAPAEDWDNDKKDEWDNDKKDDEKKAEENKKPGGNGNSGGWFSSGW
ncbi:hypothetical protein P7C71_g6355, partial [Lecanoromycetidae sp. Uapishka_2]